MGWIENEVNTIRLFARTIRQGKMYLSPEFSDLRGSSSYTRLGYRRVSALRGGFSRAKNAPRSRPTEQARWGGPFYNDFP